MKVEKILYNLNNNQLDDFFNDLENSIKKPQKTTQLDHNSLLLLNNIKENLNKTLLKYLLKTWSKLELPFNTDEINNLINFIKNYSGPVSDRALIESFAFLIDNNLPLVPLLIEGLALHLDHEQNLQELLKNIIDNSKSNPELSSLIFDISQDPEQINIDLQQYTDKLNQLMQFLLNNPDSFENSKQILSFLLGQQILNLVDSQGNLPLFFLEIPVLINNFKTPFFLFLKIEKENDGQSNKQNKKEKQKSFKISFIVELKKCGPVKSSITFSSKTIRPAFYTINTNTLSLIENTFPRLQKKLEQHGFKVNPPVLENLKNKKEFTKIIETEINLFKDKKSDTLENYKPLDIKI